MPKPDLPFFSILTGYKRSDATHNADKSSYQNRNNAIEWVMAFILNPCQQRNVVVKWRHHINNHASFALLFFYSKNFLGYLLLNSATVLSRTTFQDNTVFIVHILLTIYFYMLQKKIESVRFNKWAEKFSSISTMKRFHRLKLTSTAALNVNRITKPQIQFVTQYINYFRAFYYSSEKQLHLVRQGAHQQIA